MIREFFRPTDCPICLWGRYALILAAGALLGAFAGIWAAVPPFIAACASAGLKWLASRYPE
jgi:hypothetical protein